MKKDTIVQFVCFETPVNTDQFISHWEPYNKMVSNDQEVTLQQESEKKGRFRYISQHRCHADDFQFIFKKGRRSVHNPEIEMKVREAGGYTPVQIEYSHDTDADESKVLVFINKAGTDLEIYRQMPDYRYLNIYQAYYESCSYEYVLEFFVKNIHIDTLIQHLKSQNHIADLGVYKECLVLEK
jgi:hypothetical protein